MLETVLTALQISCHWTLPTMWWRHTALLVTPFYRWRTEARGHTTGIQPQQSVQGLTTSPHLRFRSIPAFCILLMLVNLLKHLDRRGLNAVYGRNWTRLGEWGLAGEGLLLQVEVDVMLQKLVTGKRSHSGRAGDVRVQSQKSGLTRTSSLRHSERQGATETSVCWWERSASEQRIQTVPNLCECKVFWKPRCSQWATV